MSIDIAIVDSGVNPWHSHVEKVEGGLSFYLDSSGEVMTDDDFCDQLGHGTAIAGIIRHKAPQARIHAVKIFHEKLEAPVTLLAAALRWAIEHDIKIIHLSLGTEQRQYRDTLLKLCQDADRAHIVIVAAARGVDDEVFPAVFDTVIGVYWNRDCDEHCLVYHPGNPVEFGAYGWPRSLPGLPRERNFCGNSFAAAHVTAKTARLLELNTHARSGWIREMLAKNSLRKEIQAHEKEGIMEG